MKEDMSFGISERKINHKLFNLLKGMYMYMYITWSDQMV